MLSSKICSIRVISKSHAYLTNEMLQLSKISAFRKFPHPLFFFNGIAGLEETDQAKGLYVEQWIISFEKNRNIQSVPFFDYHKVIRILRGTDDIFEH